VRMQLVPPIARQGIGAGQAAGQVQRVAQQRRPGRGHMDADLVGAARGDCHLHQPAVGPGFEQGQLAAGRQSPAIARGRRAPEAAQAPMGPAANGGLQWQRLANGQLQQG